ncbi:serine/threonine-protein kinase [Actinoplanes sp. NEAU-A12]|uniref:Serine/threonine-protein kinase n=1 Tax=Actinoplanes sandaracinus TaxID=3045177 RepID=A0ABT6WN20_9ACTN|nr:serine/threonine-protein kinase [Actinoplanes sandaracinus]MDI6101138.1 serine/threonine-protein kinase [Actinoplanes sandaracinus]
MVDDALPGERTQPLRPRDPLTLGDYKLVGRLGEGGMGTVYLARTAGGVLVAVKMVRADLAHDDEFRRRFRSEVNRARQVPPFCTAEVIDADPDHEHPYLVVEYVDGPTLAEVVEERGPLTSANLHGVAIGVATALTAIHGAGVIHRDLKPRNVLLAPGSPKVIDFGIARAMEATSANTRTDQMVGTVAYMAPERFSSEPDTPITPAADVFAWASVVAYAGTGHTPFYADSPPAMAARILTQPPRLDGLTGPLRDLVGHALEKDPANRPSSRELLDLLISGKERPAATAAAFADQPALRAAAVEAQAVTGLASTPPAEAAAENVPTLDIPPGMVGYDENSIITVPISAAPEPTLTGPQSREPGRRWALPVLVAFLIIAVVAGAVMLALSQAHRGDAEAGTGPQDVPFPSTAPWISDPLLQEAYWKAKAQPGEGECLFAAGRGLVARRDRSGTYKCKGPLDEFPGDVRVEATVRLSTPASCATFWFRNDGSLGYQVRVCESNVYFGVHRSNEVSVNRTMPLSGTPIALDSPTRITLVVRGNVLQVLRDGVQVGASPLEDKEIVDGRVVLGVYNEREAPVNGPYEVAFTDVKIWKL